MQITVYNDHTAVGYIQTDLGFVETFYEPHDKINGKAVSDMDPGTYDVPHKGSAPLLDGAGFEKTETSKSFALEGEISKVDTDKRLVFGWASVVEKGGKAVVDKQGDVMSEEDMEKMAYDFVSDCRKMGVMHSSVGGGELIESMALTKQKQEALGVDLGKSGWFVGFRVTDDKVWKRVKSGELRSFSIHGKGVRAKLAD